MKKLILAFAAIAITFGVYAQTDSTNTKMNHMDMNKTQNHDMQNSQLDKSYPDGVMMQNGKMMKVENGKVTTLDDDMTMDNGLKIKSDGTYNKKDGSKMTLKEGQHVDMSGNVNLLKTRKDKTMYLVPDSTINNK